MHLADDYNIENDLIRLKVNPQKNKTIAETLIYKVKSLNDKKGQVIMSWEYLTISLDFHLLSRAASYLFYIKIIILPLYIKNEKNTFLIVILLAFALFFFELEVFLDLGKHGGFPYQTIFSE